MMQKNMSAVLTAQQQIEIKEYPMPTVKENEVLLKVEYCGVCGSDVEFFNHGRIGTRIVNYPLILGHEAAGEIVALGEQVKNVTVGQKVVVEPGIPCGNCEFCRQGRYNLCVDMRFLSCPPNDGFFSQYVALPAANVFPLPEGLTTLEGALMEPLAVAVHATNICNVCSPKTVVILGAGCIGLCTLLSCKQRGASRVIVSDLFQNRLDLAKELGADEIVNASACDAVEKILELTGGMGADIVFETAGSKVTVGQTSFLVRVGGTIGIVGNVQGEVEFNFRNVSTREAQIKTTKRYCNDFQVCLDVVRNGGIPKDKLKKIVDKVFDLRDTHQAFLTSITDKQYITKIVIKVAED